MRPAELPRGAIAGAAFLMLAVSATELATAQTPPRVSRFGVYRGYSTARYDGWVRSSQYVTVRDGTKLAVDIFRPTRAGKVEGTPLPVIWTHTPYYRATILPGGRLATMLDYFPWAEAVLRPGYVVAAVDGRGTGGS